MRVRNYIYLARNGDFTKGFNQEIEKYIRNPTTYYIVATYSMTKIQKRTSYRGRFP